MATATLAVDPGGGLGDYELKSNSYDLAVDIELADLVQRLRFEHPEVGAVVLTGGPDKVFCAGANIQMLAGASHHHKVNFCKFTNETRLAIEDSSSHSGQVWLAAVNGTAAGGGYELAMACDEIVLVDDRSSAVSLPEVALLGVLPGTGGLTRLVDKRHVRRDLADVFSTRAEGVKGEQALAWGLVDSLAPRSRFDDHVRERALARAAESDRPPGAGGIQLAPLSPEVAPDSLGYRHVGVAVDRELGAAEITLFVPGGPGGPGAGDPAGVGAMADWWFLRACRELDDAIVRLRFNEPATGTWVLRTRGDPEDVLAAERLLTGTESATAWLRREIRLYWKRTLRRLDLSARTIVALLEPGSCFAGTLAELAFAADRSYLLDDPSTGDGAALTLTEANDGWYPMYNGITRLESRFWGRSEELAAVRTGGTHDSKGAPAHGLVTAAFDEIDWPDEIRMILEERAAFSPDALTGMEANLRSAGPETMESKIFGRLTAWQNWIFQRPNASGTEGALRRYGTGSRPSYDNTRV